MLEIDYRRITALPGSFQFEHLIDGQIIAPWVKAGKRPFEDPKVNESRIEMAAPGLEIDSLLVRPGNVSRITHVCGDSPVILAPTNGQGCLVAFKGDRIEIVDVVAGRKEDRQKEIIVPPGTSYYWVASRESGLITTERVTGTFEENTQVIRHDSEQLPEQIAKVTASLLANREITTRGLMRQTLAQMELRARE